MVVNTGLEEISLARQMQFLSLMRRSKSYDEGKEWMIAVNEEMWCSFFMEMRINTVWYSEQKTLEIATEHALIRLGTAC